MSKRTLSEAAATDATDPAIKENNSDPKTPDSKTSPRGSKKQKVTTASPTSTATPSTNLFNFSSQPGTSTTNPPLFNFNFDTAGSSSGSGLFSLPSSNNPLFPGTKSLFSPPSSSTSFLSGPSLFSTSSSSPTSSAASVLSAPSLFSKSATEPAWNLDFLNKKEDKPKSDLVIPNSTFGTASSTDEPETKADEEEKEQPVVLPVNIALTQVSVETGEEDEVKIWNSRAKCFELTTTEPKTEEEKAKGPTTEYKERGTGPVYLSFNKKSDYYRILMRADVTLKVLINSRVGEGFRCETAAPKMVRLYIIGQDAEGKSKATTFLLKMSRQEDINELIKEVDKIKGKSSTTSKTENKEAATVGDVPQ